MLSTELYMPDPDTLWSTALEKLTDECIMILIRTRGSITTGWLRIRILSGLSMSRIEMLLKT